MMHSNSQSNKSTTTTSVVIDPLRDLLGDVLLRLEALESKVGIVPSSSSSTSTSTQHHHHTSLSISGGSSHTPTSLLGGVSGGGGGGDVPASVKAYDVYMKETVIPFCTICTELGLDQIGTYIQQAWDGIRIMIVLASRSKPLVDEMKNPTEYISTLQPHLQLTIHAIQEIKNMKQIDRKYDIHMKAIYELITAVSWIYMYNVPSPYNSQLPIPFVKECMISTEFWLNRIRKDYKDNEVYIQFCNLVKPIFLQLIEYIKEYHTTGLSFNPKGISLAEAAIRYTDEVSTMNSNSTTTPTSNSINNNDTTTTKPESTTLDSNKSPTGKRHPTLGNVIVGGNVAGIIGELSKRTNADGTSAATGLKHVNKDQQTWRKEYKKDETKVVLPPAPKLDATTTTTTATTSSDTTKKDKKKPLLLGLPIFEYQDRGFKWVIENHTKESVIKEASKDGIITVDISDPKQQVYLYNCYGITVKINGKFKSLILDKCEQCAVVYDTVISSAEMVNCKKIQLQVNGICPVFTIDKTINVLIWLSAESALVSSFTTSLSSEMNISFPDSTTNDQKEVPIPEQFVHKLNNGTLSSVVSDLYN